MVPADRMFFGKSGSIFLDLERWRHSDIDRWIPHLRLHTKPPLPDNPKNLHFFFNWVRPFYFKIFQSYVLLKANIWESAIFFRLFMCLENWPLFENVRLCLVYCKFSLQNPFATLWCRCMHMKNQILYNFLDPNVLNFYKMPPVCR